MGKFGHGNRSDPRIGEPTTSDSSSRSFCGRCCPMGGIALYFSFKCLLVLILSLPVFISAVFWIIPSRSLDSGYDASQTVKLSGFLEVIREQGLILAVLLGLSAFFSMAETSITPLWPWKVRELSDKEPDNGVFRMLRSNVTRFLTTILIGTTVVTIAATALVTEAATAIFGDAGISAATGVMTVAILLLTEITPKSIAVHHATDVARFVV